MQPILKYYLTKKELNALSFNHHTRKTARKCFPGQYSSSETKSPFSSTRPESEYNFPSSRYNHISQFPEETIFALVSSFYLEVFLFFDVLWNAAYATDLPMAPSQFSLAHKPAQKDGKEISREQASAMASQLIEESVVLDHLRGRLVEELSFTQEILDEEE